MKNLFILHLVQTQSALKKNAAVLRRNTSALAFIILLLLVLPLPAAPSLYPPIPEWLIPLREALYEQELTVEQSYHIYIAAKAQAANILLGADRYNVVARCEYFMGRIYLFYNQKGNAAACFQRGYDAAEKSLAINETDCGWEMLASNLGELCTVMPASWVMTHGLEVEKFSKNALSLNPHNAAAKLLIASRWIYAPWPFSNTRKGIAMVINLLNEGGSLQKDDLFNAYTALAYGYLRENNKQETKIWIDQSLRLYPTNKYTGVTLTNCMNN